MLSCHFLSPVEGDDLGQGKQANQDRDKVQATHQLNLAKHEAVGAINQIKADSRQNETECRRPEALEELVT